MKRLLIVLLSILLLMSFTACTKKGKDDNTGNVIDTVDTNDNKIDDDKKDDDKEETTISSSESEVDLSYLFKQLDQDGTWKCPVQNFDFTMKFYVENGKYLLRVSTDYYDHEEYLINEIVKATYDNKTSFYNLYLKGYGDYPTMATTSVSTDRIADGYLKAQNFYDDHKMVEYYLVKDQNASSSYSHSYWLLRDNDLVFEYLPYVEFNADGTFEIYENLYEGMGYYKGTYEENDSYFICHVNEKIGLSGFAGQDVDTIYFEKASASVLILQTDLCYSRAGYYFDLFS